MKTEQLNAEMAAVLAELFTIVGEALVDEVLPSEVTDTGRNIREHHARAGKLLDELRMAFDKHARAG